MYQLVYSSIALKTIADSEIARMLQYAYEYNIKHGITGCLLYHGHEFIHLLEGEEEVVNELFRRIGADSRHLHVTYLHSGNAPERIFELPYMAGDKPIAESAKLSFLLSSEDLVELEVSLSASSATTKFFWTQVHLLLDTPKRRIHNKYTT